MQTVAVVNSEVVLWGQTLAYTCYVLAIMAIVGWFALRITRDGPGRVKPAFFWTFFGFLCVLGVSLHLTTANTIPWVEQEFGNVQPVQTYNLVVANHQWQLPSTPMEVPCDQFVEFKVTSEDLTYGFGLFRPNNSMVMQMQVVPGSENNLIWKFTRNGTYQLRSTEYSGPEGYHMIVDNAVHVTGCPDQA